MVSLCSPLDPAQTVKSIPTVLIFADCQWAIWVGQQWEGQLWKGTGILMARDTVGTVWLWACIIFVCSACFCGHSGLPSFGWAWRTLQYHSAMQTFGTTPLSFIVWDRPKAAQPTFADIFGTGVVWSKHWRWGQVDSSLDLSCFWRSQLLRIAVLMQYGTATLSYTNLWYSMLGML